MTDAQLPYAYRHCLALLAISYEDFGITPLEGRSERQAVIAYRAGGFLDTIQEGKTGVFIEQPRWSSCRAALEVFNPKDWDADYIREHVDSFSEARFISRLKSYIQALPKTSKGACMSVLSRSFMETKAGVRQKSGLKILHYPAFELQRGPRVSKRF